MSHGTGTAHHKLHFQVGLGLIVGLPFALISAIKAIGGGSEGFVNWLSSPIGAIGFLAFFTAAIWYCKLEFDEVVMDYFDGSSRAFGLLASKAVALIIWLMAAFAVVSIAFL
ncbi:MAG: hypothetical protein ABJG88_08250 [Litorimonas sp.]